MNWSTFLALINLVLNFLNTSWAVEHYLLINYFLIKKRVGGVFYRKDYFESWNTSKSPSGVRYNTHPWYGSHNSHLNIEIVDWKSAKQKHNVCDWWILRRRMEIHYTLNDVIPCLLLQLPESIIYNLSNDVIKPIRNQLFTLVASWSNRKVF